MPTGIYKRTVKHKNHLSRIAKEKGFGKWMIGKKRTIETRKKISVKMKGRKRHSQHL